MVKKRDKIRKKRKSSHKKIKHKEVIVQKIISHEPKMDKALMENFISLQRVMTNLAVNVDNLTNKISKLLELFEISAKALAEKDFDLKEDSEELIKKLDELADQNKVLARGIALMHERIPREQFPPPAPMPMTQQSFIPQTQQLQQPQNLSYIREISQMPPSPPPLQKRRTQETPSSPTPIKKTFPGFESPME